MKITKNELKKIIKGILNEEYSVDEISAQVKKSAYTKSVDKSYDQDDDLTRHREGVRQENFRKLNNKTIDLIQKAYRYIVDLDGGYNISRLYYSKEMFNTDEAFVLVNFHPGFEMKISKESVKLNPRDPHFSVVLKQDLKFLNMLKNIAREIRNNEL